MELIFMTDIIGISIYVMIATIFLSLVLGVIIFIRHTNRLSIKFRIIMPTKKVKTIKSREGRERIEFEDCFYIYDEQYSLNTFWGKEIYYYYNNPLPINFQSASRTDKQIPNIKEEKTLTGKEIKSMFRNHLIQELFASESLINIIMILCIGILIAVIIIGFINHPAKVTCLNINQTMDAVRIVVRGG